MPRTHVNCTVNGDEVDFLSADETSLLNALRDELGLTGVKEGCGTGDCGACTILVDGKVNCACLMFAPKPKGLRSSRLKASPKATNCTRCNRRSSKELLCNAEFAPQDSSWLPKRCSMRTPTPPKPKSATP